MFSNFDVVARRNRRYTEECSEEEESFQYLVFALAVHAGISKAIVFIEGRAGLSEECDNSINANGS